MPIWCGGGGNPELKPWLANAFDISYEWYFTSDNDNKGYLSAAFFYKNLESFIYNSDFLYDYSDEPLPPPQPGDPSSTIGIMNQPFNGEGGYMKRL